jgi:hypothetical protein
MPQQSNMSEISITPQQPQFELILNRKTKENDTLIEVEIVKAIDDSFLLKTTTSCQQKPDGSTETIKQIEKKLLSNWKKRSLNNTNTNISNSNENRQIITKMVGLDEVITETITETFNEDERITTITTTNKPDGTIEIETEVQKLSHKYGLVRVPKVLTIKRRDMAAVETINFNDNVYQNDDSIENIIENDRKITISKTKEKTSTGTIIKTTIRTVEDDNDTFKSDKLIEIEYLPTDFNPENDDDDQVVSYLNRNKKKNVENEREPTDLSSKDLRINLIQNIIDNSLDITSFEEEDDVNLSSSSSLIDDKQLIIFQNEIEDYEEDGVMRIESISQQQLSQKPSLPTIVEDDFDISDDFDDKINNQSTATNKKKKRNKNKNKKRQTKAINRKRNKKTKQIYNSVQLDQKISDINKKLSAQTEITSSIEEDCDNSSSIDDSYIPTNKLLFNMTTTIINSDDEVSSSCTITSPSTSSSPSSNDEQTTNDSSDLDKIPIAIEESDFDKTYDQLWTSQSQDKNSNTIKRSRSTFSLIDDDDNDDNDDYDHNTNDDLSEIKQHFNYTNDDDYNYDYSDLSIIDNYSQMTIDSRGGLSSQDTEVYEEFEFEYEVTLAKPDDDDDDDSSEMTVQNDSSLIEEYVEINKNELSPTIGANTASPSTGSQNTQAVISDNNNVKVKDDYIYIYDLSNETLRDASDSKLQKESNVSQISPNESTLTGLSDVSFNSHLTIETIGQTSDENKAKSEPFFSFFLKFLIIITLFFLKRYF